MKRFLLCMFLIALYVSAAFSSSTEDLLKATMNKNITPEQIVKLIEAGADVNAKDDNGWTALMFTARYNNNPQVFKTLLLYGADVNAKSNAGTTALMLASLTNNNPEVIKVLLNAGADVNAKDENGRAAIWFVRFNPNQVIQEMTKVFEWLSNLNDALIKATQDNAKYDIISLLIKHSADINAKNENGATALMVAAANTSYPEVINILANAGIDVNAKAKDGQTALMYAVRFNKNPEVIRTLIKIGADIKVTDSFFFGKTAKDWAIQSNASQEIIKILEGL